MAVLPEVSKPERKVCKAWDIAILASLRLQFCADPIQRESPMDCHHPLHLSGVLSGKGCQYVK